MDEYSSENKNSREEILSGIILSLSYHTMPMGHGSGLVSSFLLRIISQLWEHHSMIALYEDMVHIKITLRSRTESPIIIYPWFIFRCITPHFSNNSLGYLGYSFPLQLVCEINSRDEILSGIIFIMIIYHTVSYQNNGY